jgi:glycosyltransferase involved in cell wall biosynthesis
MKLSIITSLYKSSDHIKKWSKLVISTSKKLDVKGIPHEFIIVANNPDELELTELDKLKLIKNFNVIAVPLEGIYATWNRGIDNATGEILTFWNVDDKRFVSSILDGVEKIKRGEDLVYFPFIYKRYVRILGLKILAKIKVFFPPSFEREKFSREMHCGPFFMSSKKMFDKVGRFNEDFKIAGDFEWCARAAKVADFYCSKVIAGIFTNDGRTLSGSKSERHKVENEMAKGIINK